MYKCLHGLAPPYLTEYCLQTLSDTGRRYLRSATTGQLTVPHTRTISSCSVHGPAVSNSLLHDLPSMDISKKWRLLKKTEMITIWRIKAHLRLCEFALYTLWVIKRPMILFLNNYGSCFQYSFIFGLSKKCLIKPLSCFPPHINYVATLPCETEIVIFVILPLQLIQKLSSKSI